MVQFPDIIPSHPLHPSHQLSRVCFSNNQFTCNGCKTPGNDFRYRCSDTCNFNLHEFCATCPSKLEFPFFMHPAHRLKLRTPGDNHSICHAWLRKRRKGRRPTEETSLDCDLCRENIDEESEIFFACKACGFNVHPLCSRLPQHVNHKSHRVNQGDPHELELRNSEETLKCRVCKEICRGWRYSCHQGRCKIDIHIKCITSDTKAGRSGFNIFKILKGLGVTVLTIVSTMNAAVPAAGPLLIY